MKKYISLLLITVIIFLAGGCYSQRLITYDDFRAVPVATEASIDTKDAGTIDLNSSTAEGTSLHWNKGIDTLTIFFTHLKKTNRRFWMKCLIHYTFPGVKFQKFTLVNLMKSKP